MQRTLQVTKVHRTAYIRRNSLKLLAAALSVALLLAGCGNKPGSNASNSGTNASTGSNSSNTGSGSATDTVKKKSWSAPPDMQIDKNKSYDAEVTTSKGAFTIQLYAKDAPKTVNNFVFLSKMGFYDGIIFHRIIKTFMVQTGDPLGNGQGGPGYTIEDEKTPYTNYEPGIVAMARTRNPNSGGSQFFICTGPDAAASLNANPVYTVFGKVTKGMDVVQQIAATPVKQGAESSPSVPTEKVTINSIKITEK